MTGKESDMKIALLGGNSYQYAFAPSYVRANGRGYISRDQLLGQDVVANGDPTGSGSNPVFDFFTNVLDKGAAIVEDITGARRAAVETTAAQQAAAEQQARDNTALIVTGAVAGAAVLAVVMAGRKRRR
jgi:hypothetical protein